MTPEPVSAAPVIDHDVVDALRALSGDDPAAFIRELFATLIEQADVTVALGAAPDAGTAEIAAAGHRLKGAAGTVGAMRLSAAAEALEAGAGDLHRRGELLRNLQAELDLLRSAPAIRGSD